MVNISVVFVHRICVRLRAKPHRPARAARHIRHCNGRRMGRRRVTHHGVYTAARQRLCVGLAAIGLSDLASIVYGLLFQYIGWRGMFMVGVIPALLGFYIRRKVPESPSWQPTTARRNTFAIARAHWRLGIYSVVLMTAF